MSLLCESHFCESQKPYHDGQAQRKRAPQGPRRPDATPLLIDEHTLAGLDSTISVEDNDPVQFESRAQPVRVYSVASGA